MSTRPPLSATSSARLCLAHELDGSALGRCHNVLLLSRLLESAVPECEDEATEKPDPWKGPCMELETHKGSHGYPTNYWCYCYWSCQAWTKDAGSMRAATMDSSNTGTA